MTEEKIIEILEGIMVPTGHFNHITEGLFPEVANAIMAIFTPEQNIDNTKALISVLSSTGLAFKAMKIINKENGSYPAVLDFSPGKVSYELKKLNWVELWELYYKAIK